MLASTIQESVAVGNSPLAPKIGGGGGYEDNSIFSFGRLDSFDGGAGKQIPTAGFLYASLDTIRGDARLHPKNIASTSLDSCGGNSSFAESNGRVFIASGKTVYEWNEYTKSADILFVLGECIKSIASFDGYLHVATGVGAYTWYSLASGTQGTAQLTPAGPDRVNLFKVFGGILYAARGDEVWYTPGSGFIYGDSGYPPNPGQVDWVWQGPIKVGSFGDVITGLDGLLYQSLGQRYIYAATERHLVVILPGDIPYTVSQWPVQSPKNGVNMTAFYGKIYAPVGKGLLLIQSNGDMIDSGIENSVGVPCDLAGEHVAVTTTANYPVVAVNGVNDCGLWINRGSGWHSLSIFRNHSVAGVHFSFKTSRLFSALRHPDGDVHLHYSYLGDTLADNRRDSAYEYESTGLLDTGFYDGSLYDADKLWHSILVDVHCVPTGGKVEVYYTTDKGATDCQGCASEPEDGWTYLGKATVEEKELKLGCNIPVTSKSIRFKIVLRSDNPFETPVVAGLAIKYAPKLNASFRWVCTTRFPSECLTDMSGEEFEDYDQALWDCRMKNALNAPGSLEFIDIDGGMYSVVVSSFSRRVHNISCGDSGRMFDIDWSLSLLQVCPDGLVCSG